MDPLKLIAQALGLPLDSPVEKVMEKITEVKKAAGDCQVWKLRAEDNLSRLEQGQKVLKENAELRADVFMMKATQGFKITAAEAVTLKKMFMSGPEGEATVRELVDARSDQEYLTRMTALQGIKELPTDPRAEVDARANELIAKAVAKGEKLDLGEAQSQVLKADFDLQTRYNAALGLPAVGGGAR